MIAKTTQAVEAAFKAQNWNYKVDEHPSGKSSAIITGFDLKSGRSVQIFLISGVTEQGEDLAIRVFEYVTIPAGRATAALKACNEASGRYRFAKFVYQENGNVSIEMDMPAEVRNVGDVAVELLYRLLDIADDAYPIFKEALGPSTTPNASPNNERY